MKPKAKNPNSSLLLKANHQEYEAFLSSSPSDCSAENGARGRAPIEGDASVPPFRHLDQVRSDLNPPIQLVSLKLAAIHLGTGTLSLAICPQFGLSIGGSTGHHPLQHWFMTFGETGCAIACGAFFLGVSLLIAALMLRPEEIRVFRSHRLFQLLSLGVASFAAFVCFGQAALNSYAVTWLTGALLGGLGLFESTWQLRRKIKFGAFVTSASRPS